MEDPEDIVDDITENVMTRHNVKVEDKEKMGADEAVKLLEVRRTTIQNDNKNTRKAKQNNVNIRKGKGKGITRVHNKKGKRLEEIQPTLLLRGSHNCRCDALFFVLGLFRLNIF